MPTLIIDEKVIEFKQGQTIIEAALNSGIDIPHFCYHPKLSVSGNCRICLVEVEKMPKLVIACSTLASDGMVVHTKSNKTLDARNAVMEFILINHPLDCPICDEAGECKLQEYAFDHGKGESRFDEIKVRKEKRVQIGPRIKFDAERCISCSRCIRFSDEVAKSNQLTFIKRGDRITITTFPGESFDNPYTLNTVDICPVGALTNQDFRFKARVWEMSSTNSICIGCARGCNTEIWVRDNKILRLTPRQNEDVNSYWMCDHGRLNTFKHVNSETRIEGAYLRKENGLIKVSWENAIYEVAQLLKKYKGNQIGFVGSAFTTNEDNYLLNKLSKQLSAENPYILEHILIGDEDDILIRKDKTPNSLGAELCGGQKLNNSNKLLNLIKEKKIKALYVMEDDIALLSEEFSQALKDIELLIVHSTNFNKTTELAHVIFGSSTYAEKHGTMVNFQGRVQRIRPAIATEEMDRALDGMKMSRWDKFGTKYDRWMQGKKHDSKPSWKIITLLLNQFGTKTQYEMAEDVFKDISNNIKEFKGLDFDIIGNSGASLELKVKIYP